jgi:hypothetical protein
MERIVYAVRNPFYENEGPLNNFSVNSKFTEGCIFSSPDVVPISLISFWVDFFKRHPTSFLSSTLFYFSLSYHAHQSFLFSKFFDSLVENEGLSRVFFFFSNNPHYHKFISYFLYHYPSLQSFLTNPFQFSVRSSSRAMPSAYRFIEVANISILPTLPSSASPPPPSFVAFSKFLSRGEKIFCLRFGNSYIIPLAFNKMSLSEISMSLESLQLRDVKNNRKAIFSTNTTFYLHSFGRDVNYKSPVYSNFEQEVIFFLLTSCFF